MLKCKLKIEIENCKIDSENKQKYETTNFANFSMDSKNRVL